MNISRVPLHGCSRLSRHEAGIALVTALLVVSLATVAVVATASRHQLDIARTANVLDTDQAYMYALGAESWAAEILARDRQRGDIDSLDEAWAQIIAPITLDEGVLSGRIEDMQGRFNLNNLVENDQISESDLVQLRRLLEALELNREVADAAADWIDPDRDVRIPDGAEDDDYLLQRPPYRSGNTLMASPSELRLVKGFSQETYERLAPFVTALPVRTGTNLNTASAPVLMSLVDDLSQSDAETVISDRGPQGFSDVQEFLDHPLVSGRVIQADNLELSSGYFQVTSVAQFGRGRTRLVSLLYRPAEGRMGVIKRGVGGG